VDVAEQQLPAVAPRPHGLTSLPAPHTVICSCSAGSRRRGSPPDRRGRPEAAVRPCYSGGLPLPRRSTQASAAARALRGRPAPTGASHQTLLLRCSHPYTIQIRDALGKQREEAGYDTQDGTIERLTQNCADKEKPARSVAEARRKLGHQTVAEYVKQWRPRQRRMTEYSTGWHVDSSINVHTVRARKL
jgi:hypothetical protein